MHNWRVGCSHGIHGTGSVIKASRGNLFSTLSEQDLSGKKLCRAHIPRLKLFASSFLAILIKTSVVWHIRALEWSTSRVRPVASVSFDADIWRQGYIAKSRIRISINHDVNWNFYIAQYFAWRSETLWSFLVNLGVLLIAVLVPWIPATLPLLSFNRYFSTKEINVVGK